MPLTAGTLALLMAANSAAQPTAPAPAPVAAPDATVSDTRLGLENLQLLQKGISPGGQGAALTPEQLISTPEILTVDPTPEVPEADSDESTLRELRRRQWSQENWLVDGMRRSELAADEADLAEDNLAAQSGGARSAEDTSARARVEAGTSNEWLALAVETQRETESGAGHADAPRRPGGCRRQAPGLEVGGRGSEPPW